MLAAFSTAFQTHVFSILPSSFSHGFKSLVASTLNPDYATKPPMWMATLFPSPPDPTRIRWDQPLWLAFEHLGMIERYESLISSVCYEHIESHIVESCSKIWDQPSLADMRTWMTDQIVPWLIMPYARGARTGRSRRIYGSIWHLPSDFSGRGACHASRYRLSPRLPCLQSHC